MNQELRKHISDDEAMKQFGLNIGAALRGGELFELVGDVGAGKTTFTKGLALGMGITEPVQSPTFTINRVYDTPHGLRLAHYDFYRLQEAGIMSDELHEVVHEPTTVTVIEWAAIVEGVLPSDRIRLHIQATTETDRLCTLTAIGPVSRRIVDGVAK